MYSRRIILGFTLVSILIGLFILACAVSILLKTYPVIMGMSQKGKNLVNISFIADKIFTQIEEIYGSKETILPSFLEGTVDDFPDFKYKINFKEEKEDLYKVELELFWQREGKYESKYFVSTLRRR
ncbi:MAG: hypothetical protein NC926_02900 [Candidatus Omnitrophica bacterium]|nr:hypothetical protein [Candidatus Omnitrophota bacterium]MCM8806895.1 hypothetical protein [Candidatus Omnitrophota bacterium]